MKQESLPQVVATGIYDSRIAAKNKTVSKNRKTAMFEIELITESGGISYIDNDVHKIEPNLIICAKPGQIRHTKFPFRCYYIHLMVDEGMLSNALSALPDFMTVSDPTPYVEIFTQLRALFDSPEQADAIKLHSLVLDLTYRLSIGAREYRQRTVASRKRHKTIEAAIKYINENLSSDLSLDTVSQALSFSPIHFHNFFKSATGKTLRDYVEGSRIKKAAELLLTTELTLTDIATRCGFSSQSYFSFVFKRRMGITPREYVRQINAQYEQGGGLP